MTLDLDDLENKTRYAMTVPTCVVTKAELAALVELGKERDYAMEMVNVQDNQIDALRALLKVAQDCIYSLDAREIYADELARIDAALKVKP